MEFKLKLMQIMNSNTEDVIIRQLFYPFKQWKAYTNKKISLVFFEKRGKEFCLWEYAFEDENNYNSIKLIRYKNFIIGS